MATIKFIQAQKFSLAGSGASIGDTTITLQSFAQIGGTLLTTTDLGVKAYGTLEPGNGSQEEQISFTGVTQNSNGTATLTGVSTVGFVSPYTETSGIAKTHAGATTFILSNDAGFYGQILNYVDTAIVSGGVPSTTSVLGIVKMSAAPASAASPIAVGDNDPRMGYLSSVSNTGIPYAVATGTATALTATLASAISTLASGASLNFLVPLTTASGVTLNVNSLGAKTIKKAFSSSLASGDLLSGEVAQVVYDGTGFQLQTSPSLTPFINTFATGGTWTKPAGLKYVIVEVVGGGGSGGGGGVAGTGGSGGGAGGYSRKSINAATLGSTETVTVGAGGVAGAAGVDGNAGNTSSFGAHCSATGGAAGRFGNGGGTPYAIGGLGSGGTVNVAGGSGGSGSSLNSGSGGDSVLGGGGPGYSMNQNAANTAGIAASGGYGGGGGGGYNLNTNVTGGAGSNGIVIVTEYYN